jgi:hypothetical protein
MKDCAFKVRGRWWRLIFEQDRKEWGLCDHENKTIYVEQDASRRMKAETIIHEMCHARLPYLVEDEVNGFAGEVVAVLERLDLLNL